MSKFAIKQIMNIGMMDNKMKGNISKSTPSAAIMDQNIKVAKRVDFRVIDGIFILYLF